MELFKPEDISTLCLGVQGENKSRIIQIDVSDWLKEFPNANINILVTRPTETTPYIANTSVINGIFTWLISDSDTTYSGLGKAELRATQDDIIKKSLTYLTSIKESLEGVPSPLPPEPSESWVNAVIKKANEVLNSRVESFNINEQGHLIATLEDGTTQDLGSVVGGVSSVNGQTGDVILTANDLNAYTKTEVNTELEKKQDVLQYDGEDLDAQTGLTIGNIYQCIKDYEVKGNTYVDNCSRYSPNVFIDGFFYLYSDVDYFERVDVQPSFSGSYNDLTDTPTIPTQTSQLTNNSGFITNAVNNLANYYLKTDTYTQTEVNNLIGAIQTAHFEVVSTLPQTGESNVIYLLSRSSPETRNYYDEYIYINNDWEKIGNTDIDLTGYATETWVNTQIAAIPIQGLINAALTNYYTKTEVDTALGNKENTSNKVTSLSAQSTDTQYPSAKCVYNIVGNIESLLSALR